MSLTPILWPFFFDLESYRKIFNLQIQFAAYCVLILIDDMLLHGKQRGITMSKKDRSETTKIATSYNSFGRTYHETRTTSGRLFNEYLEMPAVLSILPQSLKHKTVVDAGCGGGIYSVILAKLGAKVLGIDISQTMIDIANEEKPADLDITYSLGNLYDIQQTDESVDLIVCNYVLENLAELNTVFTEFHRVLKKDGLCLFSISHPLRAFTEKEFFQDKEIWRLENYFAGGTRTSDFGQGMTVLKFKRTCHDYLQAAFNAGFLANQFLEPQPIPEGKKCHPQQYEQAMRLPQLLIVGLIKPSK